MTILENIETAVGMVTGELIEQKSFERWTSEHPDHVVLMCVPYVLMLHTKLPDGRSIDPADGL